MKFTRFIIKAKNKNGIVLLNTLNEAVIGFSNQRFNEVIEALKENKLDMPEIKRLIEMEFLVPKGIKEKSRYIDALKKEWESNKNFCLHILPTTACNFKCVYCYQCGIERNHSLNQTKIEQINSYLNDYLKDKKLKTATVVIHGGEPTVNWAVVPNILSMIDSLFKLYKIKYNVQIVTNGYNLTLDKAQLLSKYNWNRLQVTIDGPKEIHNRRRMLLNGGGTYDRIVENIRLIQEKKLIKRISIRVNFDEKNWRAVKSYLPQLKKLFGTKNIVLSFGYVSDTIPQTDAEDYISENVLSNNKLANAYVSLYKEALMLGYEMQDLFMFDGMCTAKLKNALVISSDGNIFKCLSGVGREEFVVSNISKRESLPNYLFLDMYDECFKKKCPYIPICNTGCRFNGFLKTGNIHSNDCKKATLNKINRRLIKIKYLEDDIC